MSLNNLDLKDPTQLPLIDYYLKKIVTQTRKSRILLQCGHHHLSVNIDEIIYGKADAHYTVFVLTSGKEIMASQGIKFYCDSLVNRGFFRANRSCILNISHISSIYKKETIILSNNEKINIPVRNKGALTELLESLK